MTDSPARPVQPRLLRGLAIAGTTIGLTAAPVLSGPMSAPMMLPTSAPIWLAQGEGGEGGEAGAVADATPDVAYLAQLHIVEGHLVAALDLYAKGLKDEAVGLSYHPEAEMMDEVREGLAAHGVPDVTPAMTAFSEAMERGADLSEVEAALSAAQAAFATAAAPEADEPATRAAAIVVLLRAAAHEYEESTEDGTVGDVMAYHEAHGFVQVARNALAALATLPEAKAAAEKALAATQGADEAFGDMSGAELEVHESEILMGVAARVELALSSVR